MGKPMKLRMFGLALTAAAVVCACSVRAQGPTLVLAVAEIHYVDTSGEVIDQSADHRRRLREFEAALDDVEAKGGDEHRWQRAQSADLHLHQHHDACFNEGAKPDGTAPMASALVAKTRHAAADPDRSGRTMADAESS